MILAHGADQHNTDVPRINMISEGGRILWVMSSQMGQAEQRRIRNGWEAGKARWGSNRLGGVTNNVILDRSASISFSVCVRDECVVVLRSISAVSRSG